MKILSIGNFTTGWDGSICDEEHIANALENLGNKVIRVQRTEIPSWEAEKPDFILVAQWDGFTDEYLGGLKAEGAPVVYWAFDYQADGQEWHERLVKQSDLYLSKRMADVKYPNWQWLSQDFSPSFLDRYPGDIEQDIDVLFTGSYLPWAKERNDTLKRVDKIYNLEIHSFTPDAWKAEGFKNVHGPSMDDALPRLIARAKINLSIDHTIEAGYWSDRNAQIMACGGFTLFRYVAPSTSVFHDGLDYFDSPQECLDIIDFYLNHPRARELIAENGYKLAHDTLMVEDRVRDLLTIVRESK